MSEKVPDLGGWRSCDLCCVFILQADVPSAENEEEQSEQAAE